MVRRSRLGGFDELERAARRLSAREAAGKRGRAPALLFVTDPDRTPDPAAVAERLPRGAGIVFRGFGRADAGVRAAELAAVARRRGLVLLVGADVRLAAAVRADGVHLPERALHVAPRLRARRPDWLITGAVHSGRALRRAARFGLDAALLSPAFPSRSPSAARALGPVRFAHLVRDAALPVLALGGVTGATARRLADTGAAGLAAVDAFSEAARER